MEEDNYQAKYCKNDHIFMDNVLSLKKSSLSMSSTALSLVELLDEAEKEKFEKEELENLFEFKDKKPLGTKTPSSQPKNVLYYKTHIKSKSLIEEFVDILEKYDYISSDENKLENLERAKYLYDELKLIGENPKYLIHNPIRKKVWSMIDQNYLQVKKQFQVGFFIREIKNTRLQFQDELNGLVSYNKRRLTAFKNISIARKNDNTVEVSKQQYIINEKLGVDIEPLLQKTKKILTNLQFNLEEIPEFLNEEQKEEVQKFIPVISEYYIDQNHQLSGGYSYTGLDEKLKDFQTKADKSLPVANLIVLAENLGNTMQHLYILHWIGENLMKYVLSNNQSMGGAIRTYDKAYSYSKSDLKMIIKAVDIRNDIAHNALIWNPQKIDEAIKIYRTYIYIVAQERDVDLTKFKINKEDRAPSKEKIDENNKLYLHKTFNIYEKELEKYPKVLNSIKNTMKKFNWNLNEKQIKSFKHEIETIKKDEFSNNYFECSYSDLKIKIEKNVGNQNTGKSLSDWMNKLTWSFHNQDNDNFKLSMGTIKRFLNNETREMKPKRTMHTMFGFASKKSPEDEINEL